MRRALIVACVVTIVSTLPINRADATAVCYEGHGGTVVGCLGQTWGVLPGSSGSGAAGTTIPPADQYVWPVLTTGANGECILIRTIVAPGGASSQNALDGESLLMTLLQSY